MKAKPLFGLSLVVVLLLSLLAAVPVSAGDPIGWNFAIHNGGETEVQPAIAYNHHRQEYLVVWYNDRPGNDDIRAQRVSKQGKLVGGPFYISAGPGADRRDPSVAYNSRDRQYLVVWEQVDQSWGYQRIKGRRVSETGQVLDGNDILFVDGSNLSTPSDPVLTYASTSEKYLLVWDQIFHPSPVSDFIMTQALNRNGSPAGGEIPIAEAVGGGGVGSPDVAYNRSRNEYLVVWQHRVPGGADFDIRARRVQGNGTPMAPNFIEIDKRTGHQYNPAVAAIPTVANQGHYLVVWEDHWVPADADIFGRRVNGQGQMISNYFPISRANEDQRHPDVAGSEEGQAYLVVWTHEYKVPLLITAIRGQELSLTGEHRGEDKPCGGWDADHAIVAQGPLADFMVAFDDPPPGVNRGIYGQRWGTRVYLPLAGRRFK
jgi:hypothetical protein